MSAVLHLDNVTRIHGDGATAVTALQEVSFRAHAGELVAARCDPQARTSRLVHRRAAMFVERAVGMANSLNAIAIVVPCHRVIGANGTLTGYAGGVDRKRWLLNHESGITAGSLRF